jgi:hypothetical protein
MHDLRDFARPCPYCNADVVKAGEIDGREVIIDVTPNGGNIVLSISTDANGRKTLTPGLLTDQQAKGAAGAGMATYKHHGEVCPSAARWYSGARMRAKVARRGGRMRTAAPVANTRRTRTNATRWD